MLRGLLFLAAVIVAVGVLTGVVEVSVHTDRLAEVPSRLTAILSNQEILEQVRAQAVKVKRAAEQKMVNDEQRKLELALLYVKADAERLEEIRVKIDDNPGRLLPQAELLAGSLDRARHLGETASAETLIALKDKTNEVYGRAKTALDQLKTLATEYQELQTKFSTVTAALEEHIGRVAGDSQVPASSPSPSAIPLEF